MAELTHSYILVHDEKPDGPSKQIDMGGAVIYDLAYVLRFLAAMPRTGEYKVYDVANHSKKVVTITHHDYRVKKGPNRRPRIQ